MRKHIHIILSRLIQTCFIASLLAGCTKVVPDDSFEQKSRIGFNTAMTKAAVGYPTNSKFISTAYTIASDKTWDNASDRAGAAVLINEEEVSYNNTEKYWSTTETAHYWDANRKYTFFSYSPSSLKGTKVSVSTDGVAISNWDVEADATTEILVADIAKDKTKNESFSGYSGVPTNFRQKLSKLSFNMGISQDAEADTKVTLLGIKIVGICTQGNYSKGGYTDDAWTVVEGSRKTGTPETSVFTVFSDSQELSKTDFFPASKLIIPQSLLQSGSYHPTLIVKYQIQVGKGAVEIKTAECHFDINLRQESWEKGMEYTYTIHIGVGQYPIEFDGTVDPWNVVNNGEVNIG